MKNNFSKATQILFGQYDNAPYQVCWECGRYHADCLHHIFGRCSNSAFNCAPLNNNDCHLNKNGSMGGHETHGETAQKYLYRTIVFLKMNEYEPTPEDQLFIAKYSDHDNLQVFKELFE